MLKLASVTKTFPGTVALSEVNFDLRPGEVHVLFGENGAGKSTLINIIAGTFQPTSGTIMFDGEPVEHMTPALARHTGIAAVFQEFSLVPSLSVLDNLFLGREVRRGLFADRRAMLLHAQAIFKELAFDVDLNAEVGMLSRAQMQMTEIAKALIGEAKVLILDEPTASLSDHEADHVLEVVKKLKAKGVGIIYVSHRMREIRELADRITVLRSGRFIECLPIADASEETLVKLMTGRRVDELYPQIDHKPGKVVLMADNISTKSGSIRDVTINVRAGEIVGVAGLVGGGKGALGRAIFGLDPISTGSIKINGHSVVPRSPRQMLAERVCYFPADRGSEGLAMNRSILENGSMAALDRPRFAKRGLLQLASEKKIVSAAVEQLTVRPSDISRNVGELSGGNKQKVMLARGLTRDIDLCIFDEPTVGIDIGAKVEVYAFIKRLVEDGVAVIVISSEITEVLNLSNRAYVMHDGELVAEFKGEDKNETNVLSAFFGRREEGLSI